MVIVDIRNLIKVTQLLSLTSIQNELQMFKVQLGSVTYKPYQ